MAGENYSVLLKAITATEPTFNFSFRGYDRRQVDQYAHTTEAQLAATLADSRQLAAEVSTLTDNLRLAENELAELRRRPTVTDKISFRHLGVRVEQILSEAEEQAELSRRDAAEEAERMRTQLAEESARERATVAEEVARERAEVAEDTERQRADVAEEVAQRRGLLAEEVRQAREMEARVLGELDDARRACSAEESRVTASVERSQADVARAELELNRLRVASDHLLATAQEEYERVTTSAMETAERIHAELAIQTRALREEAHEEASSVTLAAQAYAEQTLAEAEQHAAEFRELLERYSSRLGALVAPDLVKPKGRHARELSATSMRALADRPARDGAPHEDAPHEDAPHEDAPHEDAPHEDAPHEDAPHEDAPHEDAPHEDAPHEDAPHEDAPHEDAPHEDALYEDASYEDASYDGTPDGVDALLDTPMDDRDDTPVSVAAEPDTPKA